MSVRVTAEVYRCSEAELGTRLVLLALADSAHHDGVTWLYQGTIAKMTRLADSTVREAIKRLEAAGEVEVRKAQRGRKRVNVYRVIVGRIAEEEVDYDRLPFTVVGGFSPPPDIGGRETGDDRRSTEPTAAEDRRSPAREPLGDPSKDPPSVANAPSGSLDRSPDPPKTMLVHYGVYPSPRNLPMDYLARVVGYDVTRPADASELAVALNGGRAVRPGIRADYWRGANDTARAAWLADPRLFEEMLASTIEKAADLYRRKMPGATITPTALAKWWTRLQSMPDPAGSRMTAEDVLRGG